MLSRPKIAKIGGVTIVRDYLATVGQISGGSDKLSRLIARAVAGIANKNNYGELHFLNLPNLVSDENVCKIKVFTLNN